jgi:hypothetical protein
MKKEMMAKIMAIIALLWITIWVLWTGLLAIFWDKYSENTQTKTPTEKDLQNMIDNWKVRIETWAEKNIPESKLLEEMTSSWLTNWIKNNSWELKK